MRLIRTFLVAIALLGSTAPARADVKAAAVFGDNMVLQRDAMLPVWGTAAPDEQVRVEFEQKTTEGQRRQTASTTVAGKDGRWLLKIGPFSAGGEPGILTMKGTANQSVICKNVLIGDVWLCSGQSNMEWTMQKSSEADKNIAAAMHPQIRLLQVPHKAAPAPLVDFNAKWVECAPESVKNFSAVAYYFGRYLHGKLNVPIGLIDDSYGGTPAEAWTSREALTAVDSLKYYVEDLDKQAKAYDPQKTRAAYEEALARWKIADEKAKKDNKSSPRQPRLQGKPGTTSSSPSSLYNAMIAPLVPFAIKGVIWYQGESNANKAYEYRTLFPTMIRDWRARWHQGDFPFLFVQLAPYRESDSNGVRYAELRDAQLHTALTVDNTAVAVITDVGNETDIHPKQKEPVGTRLALAALAKAYGMKVEYSGPIFKSKQVIGNKLILTFDHVGGGLTAKDGKLTGFAIAGADGTFVDADAVIEDGTVVLTSPSVDKPIDVRYGWKNYMKVNLYNKDGLPASPFRTDTTPYTTMQTKR